LYELYQLYQGFIQKGGGIPYRSFDIHGLPIGREKANGWQEFHRILSCKWKHWWLPHRTIVFATVHQNVYLYRQTFHSS